MTETELDAALKRLQTCVQELAGLLAWEQLQRDEARPGQPPGFRIKDPVETDLRNQYSRFLLDSAKMHHLLSEGTLRIPKAKHHRMMWQLGELERQVHGMNLGRRFTGVT
jgi:hypothetical protein